MDTFNIQFYDLLSRALGGNDNKRIQDYLDTVMAAKYNSLQLDGFTFNDDMQLDFTYEQVQNELKMSVMAQYVDVDAPAIPLGAEGFTLETGKIPRQKMVEYLNEDKARKQLLLEQRLGADSSRAINSAKDKFFTTVDTLFGGHTNSLIYQRHQVVSAGKLHLTDTNNPRGIKDVTFASHIPSGNITTKTSTARWWTSVSNGVYSSEGAACDPIKDLKKMVRNAQDKGVSAMHFEIDKLYADQVVQHSKIVEAIAIRLYPGAIGDTLTGFKSNVAQQNTDDLLVLLGKIVGAPFKVIDSIVSVEKWDDTNKKLSRPQFRAFEANVLVLVPDGSLGEVITVEPIALAGGNYGSFYGGKLLLTIDFDYVKKCQSYNTEMTSLVVPDKPQYMWYIHPYSA